LSSLNLCQLFFEIEKHKVSIIFDASSLISSEISVILKMKNEMIYRCLAVVEFGRVLVNLKKTKVSPSS